MQDNALSKIVESIATEYGIPGVAVGVWADGQEFHANYGVTNIEAPVEVDSDTVFAIGSISKTFTTTALLCLVADGKLDLDAPVRHYLPELVLADEHTAATITLRQLLNHTAGFDWNIINDMGEGDSALADFTASLSELPLIAAPGERASYSQAGFNLLGRVIEKVTGQPFETAVEDLVLTPAGLSETFYSRDAVMTRRFAVGHERQEDGTLSVSRQWKGNRANNAGGGIGASVSELLRWARFQLGDGHAENGTPVLPADLLHLMQQPTVTLRASSLGDAIGLCWFLRDVDGVRTVGHGGSGFGQFAELLLVPARNFAVVILSNASPEGIPTNLAILRWTLEHYLAVIDKDPTPIPFDPEIARAITGHYEIDAMTIEITTEAETLTLDCKVKPEIRAAAPAAAIPQDHPPFEFALLPNNEYMITKGSFEGQRGFFTYTPEGTVTGLDLAGRLFTRTA
ncbi:serine hydrolase domain-containing protein [Nocardia sp. NPDC020380]|uniref:serine hydrolase domain-containing protein n=1 Tax=Nocardia sp. NPDC020380 TaxID=3364309 RepID=UPI0037AC2018